MNKKFLNEKYFEKIAIKILFLLFLIKSIRTQNCTRKIPILKDGNCVLEYCTQYEFNKKNMCNR